MHHRSGAVQAKRREDGASLIEYVLLLALIVIVALTAVSFFGTSLTSRMDRSNDCFAAADQPVGVPGACP